MLTKKRKTIAKLNHRSLKHNLKILHYNVSSPFSALIFKTEKINVITAYQSTASITVLTA